MQQKELKKILSDPARMGLWLQAAGVTDEKKSSANLKQIATADFSEIGLLNIVTQLRYHLPIISDPDLALNSLERFISSAPDADELGRLFLADQRLVPALVQIFSNSRYLSDVLVRDHDCFEQLLQTGGRPYSLQALLDIVCDAVMEAKDKPQAMRILRQFKRQQTLRIAYGDLIDGHRIEHITEQISFVAMAICEAAYRWARRELEKKFGVPINLSGDRSQYAILALGKLGGGELNYSSDIDLMMVYDTAGETHGSSPQSNQHFFGQLTRDIVKLINEKTDLGAAHRVDLRLRPEGSRGAICHSVATVLRYYELQGRTWERQALIKAKPIAGDLELGDSVLNNLEDWIYQISMSRSDISGIKSLKRKIERRAAHQGEEDTNVKTGRGGIRDIEFVIQFMQLLNGASEKKLRTTNTLDAIARLERAGCLTVSEATKLSQNYRWLRKLEHRLQMMFDLQTHTLPDSEAELEKIAVRMGYVRYAGISPLEQFRSYLRQTRDVNRRILNHLLHGAFGPANVLKSAHPNDDDDVPIEVELVFEPDPSDEMIQQAFAPYGFKDLNKAFRILMELTQERTQFLSNRRCQHFFAAIAQSLLTEVAKTPDPDATLVSLSAVSDSLGAKGVLWELFSFNPPTLSLYVRLCASSDYLASIFKRSPGMIDELMDGLQLKALPEYDRLAGELEQWTRGAEDPDLIVLAFKNTYHMRVGIRDILGKDDIRDTHHTLSDVAQVCLQTVAKRQFCVMAKKYFISDKTVDWTVDTPFAILGLGKLGGREPNYHSDLDVVFLYEPNEQFESQLRAGITSQFFFSQWAAGITRAMMKSTPLGRIYEVDSRLRPTGKSGSLAVSMDEFLRYFQSGRGQLWERQSLCKARVVYGTAAIAEKTVHVVRQALSVQPWNDSMAQQIRSMRHVMEKGASPENLKRGVGGTVDIEFIVQMLQLKNFAAHPTVMVPGTIDAIERLVAIEQLNTDVGAELKSAYQLLRSVESGLRLMNVSARHDLPTEEKPLAKLAFLLDYPDGTALVDAIRRCRTKVRDRFNQILG